LAVHIRLRRTGAKKQAHYRIVAADSRSPRDGRFLERLGTYHPIAKPAQVSVFEDKMTKWLDEGAVPSHTVKSLLTQIGFTEKYQKAKKGEDVSEITLKATIKERAKKTRRMKKAAVASAETKSTPTAEASPETKPNEDATE
jgi:small subunit ribosomal protein S16